MELIYNIGIILFALAGVFLAGYIAKQKNHHAHLVCPLGHSCDAVINGKHSRFFGIRIEFIGLAYYLLTALFYLVNIFYSFPQSVVFGMLVVTTLSFVFSVHLLATQLFLIKKWCTLCIGSSAISFMILVMSFLGFQSSFGEYLFGYHDFLSWIFGLSVLVGVVSASLHARTFIKFLRDFEISKKESKRLAMFGHVGWVVITLSILSGAALVWTDLYHNITGGNQFTTMALILAILIVYEVVVNMLIAPHLVEIHFDEKEVEEHKHMSLRKSAFAFMAVGIVSWYIMLFLMTVPLSLSSLSILIIYFVFLILAVVFALFVEHLFYRKALRSGKIQIEEGR